MLEIFEEGRSFLALGCSCACGCECICSCGEIPASHVKGNIYRDAGNKAMMDQFYDIAG